MMRLDVLPLLDVLLSNIFLDCACILLASCKPNTGVHFIIVQQLVRVLMHSDTMHPNTTEINKQTNQRELTNDASFPASMLVVVGTIPV